MNARAPLAPPSTSASAPGPAPATLLAALVQLEQQARACVDTGELAFVMVNELHALAPYRQAVLWRSTGIGDGGGRIAALSGLAVPDAHAPFNVWLEQLLAQQCAGGLQAGPLTATPQDTAMWREHLPPHAWCLPLQLSADNTNAAPAPDALLLLLRDSAWQGADTALLPLAADACSHAWRALERRQAGPQAPLARLRKLLGPGQQRQRPWWLAGAVALLVLLCLPVRQSVLAPAEVVARAPMTVRAPLQGVVDHIAVRPNQSVKQGDLLVQLDARELAARLESARQAQAVAEAELRQGQQQALFDERSRATLGLLSGKREQAAGEVDYLEKAMARTRIHAGRAGTVIFDDPAEWTGKPVALGERIMQVADPAATELDIALPVADAIALAAGASVQLFLNTAPATPLAASVQRVGYRASPGGDGTLAYRVRAGFSDADAAGSARIGLKGTAKLYGERTLLIVYLLRRPLATLRVWLGV